MSESTDPARSEMSARLVKAAYDVLGNDTGVVLDCSTAVAIAAVLRELADHADNVEMALSWDLYLHELADELDRPEVPRG